MKTEKRYNKTRFSEMMLRKKHARSCDHNITTLWRLHSSRETPDFHRCRCEISNRRKSSYTWTVLEALELESLWNFINIICCILTKFGFLRNSSNFLHISFNIPLRLTWCSLCIYKYASYNFYMFLSLFDRYFNLS